MLLDNTLKNFLYEGIHREFPSTWSACDIVHEKCFRAQLTNWSHQAIVNLHHCCDFNKYMMLSFVLQASLACIVSRIFVAKSDHCYTATCVLTPLWTAPTWRTTRGCTMVIGHTSAAAVAKASCRRTTWWITFATTQARSRSNASCAPQSSPADQVSPHTCEHNTLARIHSSAAFARWHFCIAS